MILKHELKKLFIRAQKEKYITPLLEAAMKLIDAEYKELIMPRFGIEGE